LLQYSCARNFKIPDLICLKQLNPGVPKGLLSTGMKVYTMAKKGKNTTESSKNESMKLFYIFYNQERWDNWIKTLTEVDFTGEDEEEMPEGYQLLYNFNLDICLSVLKIIKLYQNNRFTLDDTKAKIDEVEQIVMTPVQEEELAEIIDSLQLSVLVLFASARLYLEGGYEGDVKTLVKNGREAVDSDMEEAMRIACQIGANVINGSSCCGKYIKDNMEPTLFDEWLIEIETMNEAFSSLKKFDEEAGEGS